MALDSGLLYKVIRKGGGKAHPLVGTSCECHYEGTLIDGTKFDSSYDRGSPTSFAPNQVANYILETAGVRKHCMRARPENSKASRCSPLYAMLFVSVVAGDQGVDGSDAAHGRR